MSIDKNVIHSNIIFSVGLVAAGGAWKGNKEYKYDLVVKTFRTIPGSYKPYADISHIRLTIRPQSADILIGRIIEVGSIDANKQVDVDEDSNMSDKIPAINDVPINKEFMIHLKNGAIESLSVDRTMTSNQIYQLKFIVSQFQIDTKAYNVMQSENNHLPNASTNDAFYTTMEPTVAGVCATTYDISRLAEYLTYANRESIPLPELDGGAVVEIVKSMNYNNCKERARYLLALAGIDQTDDTNQLNNNLDASLTTRILVTGSLEDYTIQSSVTTFKLGDLSEYIYLTLESVQQSNADREYQQRNMDNIGNLVYKMDSQNNFLRMDDTENRLQHQYNVNTIFLFS